MFKPCKPDNDLVGGDGMGEKGRFVFVFPGGGGSNCPLEGSVNELSLGRGSFFIGKGLWSHSSASMPNTWPRYLQPCLPDHLMTQLGAEQYGALRRRTLRFLGRDLDILFFKLLFVVLV